jgi:hypothetical protein
MISRTSQSWPDGVAIELEEVTPEPRTTYYRQVQGNGDVYYFADPYFIVRPKHRYKYGSAYELYLSGGHPSGCALEIDHADTLTQAKAKIEHHLVTRKAQTEAQHANQ